MTTSGSLHDRMSGSFMYDTLPGWIRDEDEELEKNAGYPNSCSYFDTLYSQITALSTLKKKKYYQIDNPYFEDRPPAFVKRMIESKGTCARTISKRISIRVLYGSDLFRKYSKSIEQVKM